MKNYSLCALLVGIAFITGSCAPEEINTEFSVTGSALSLIPAKAVSCYSAKITGTGQTPAQDIDESYFTIPTFTIWRADSTKDLIISTIRVTYNIPATLGAASQDQKCVFAGDNLRALSSTWWSGGAEAKIKAGTGTTAAKFVTDCSAMCGGITTNIANVSASGNVEIYGLERDPVTLEESPVKLQGYITIQGF
jgi:hypothetical protein